jgi:uncharacterized protein YuzE
MKVNTGVGVSSFANEPGHGSTGRDKILERIMKVTYDTEVDVLRILFNNGPIEESETIMPGFILDYDKGGSVVGLEVLDASKRIENPRAMEFVIAS